jgi:hypothetical protein
MKVSAIEQVVKYYQSIVDSLPIGGFGVKVLHDALVELAALKAAESAPTDAQQTNGGAKPKC